jgi:cell division protease FtsH
MYLRGGRNLVRPPQSVHPFRQRYRKMGLERVTHDIGRRIPRQFTAGGSGRKPSLIGWKPLVAAGVLLVALVALVPFALLDRGAPPQTLTYSELLSAVEAGRVGALEITPGQQVSGTWIGTSAATDFVVVYPVEQADALVERAAASGASVVFSRPATRRYTDILTISLQVFVFAAIGYILFLQLRGGNISKVGGRGDSTSTTTFEDVAGTQGASEELSEIVDFLKQPAAFAAMGARVPKGVLLSGPPGTGKTLLARAVAGEADVPFFHISGSEITGFVVGLGAHRIRSLFAKARKKGGVIFIDEIDALGGARGRNRSHNEDDRTLNQLLVEMDGFAPTEGVVVVGATNRPEDLDPALKRPGRFDRLVNVGLPAVDGRAAILRLHSERRAIPVAAEVDFDRLARLTPGASGADLANLLNEAAIAAVRTQSPQVGWQHFEAARDRMLLGKERVGFRAPDVEWRIVAYHEAGHALAGVVACPEDGLHKVTIQPRGHAMGVAHFAPDADRHLHTRHYLEAQIIKGLGGRVAEELVFGADHVTGGAESDLVHVNRVARQMVYRLGMGDHGGLLVYDPQNAPLSADAQARMDVQVAALLERLYARTREIITAHRPALEALAAALLERETLEGDEALRLVAAAGTRVELPVTQRALSAAAEERGRSRG